MKKIAMLGDLHGNLTATLAMEKALKDYHVDEIWFLGDAVGKGPQSRETCDWVRANCTRFVGGNWDYGIGGKRFASEEFAKTLQATFDRSFSCITFVIGGSLGLCPAVTSRADLLLSVSDMTLPHGLCRVVLLEQIYRAFKINAREPYHK